MDGGESRTDSLRLMRRKTRRGRWRDQRGRKDRKRWAKLLIRYHHLVSWKLHF